jgi:hypothetical protein
MNQRQKIVYASLFLEHFCRLDRWTQEDLAVAAWRLFPDDFGLDGFAFPSSQKVYAKLLGQDGILARDWLRRDGDYLALTSTGRAMVAVACEGLPPAARCAPNAKVIRVPVWHADPSQTPVPAQQFAPPAPRLAPTPRSEGKELKRTERPVFPMVRKKPMRAAVVRKPSPGRQEPSAPPPRPAVRLVPPPVNPPGLLVIPSPQRFMAQPRRDERRWPR